LTIDPIATDKLNRRMDTPKHVTRRPGYLCLGVSKIPRTVATDAATTDTQAMMALHHRTFFEVAQSCMWSFGSSSGGGIEDHPIRKIVSGRSVIR
jgi:hypothetical protein